MRRVREVIRVARWSEGPGKDRYGNLVEVFADPVDVGVYGVSPKQSVEPDEQGRRAVLSGLTVYAPPDVVVGPRDRVFVRGKQYEVEGEPGFWQGNPFIPFTLGGIQFDLERSEG